MSTGLVVGTYSAKRGYVGKAYLEASFTAGGEEYLLGTNKHTDEPVPIRVLDDGYEEV